MERAKEGDRFIKPDTGKIYEAVKVVMSGDWVVLKEEEGNHQILTSQESLGTWEKYRWEEGTWLPKAGGLQILLTGNLGAPRVIRTPDLRIRRSNWAIFLTP